MKIIKNINSSLGQLKNLLPYLLLISVYFFFVNLEAQQEQKRNLKNSKDKLEESKDIYHKSNYNDNNLRITIPVVPYKE